MKENIPQTRALGRRLPRFTGNRNQSIFNSADIDAVILDRLEALSNVEVRIGTKPGAILSDRRLIIMIPPTPAASGGGINFRGEYDPDSTYGYLDLVFISAGSNQGAFLFISKSASKGSDHPPYAGGNFWSAWPGSAPLGQWM